MSLATHATGGIAMAEPLVLTRPMASAAPEWDHAVWIGTVELSALDAAHGGVLHLVDGEGHRTCRLLVRDGAAVLGFVEGDVHDATVDLDGLRRQLEPLRDGARPAAVPTETLSFTVVICSRDRADQLRGALQSVLALDYPRFDVLVVDNASATSATRDLVETEFAGRVDLVEEPTPGLATARNTGLRFARGEVVAFTDDDVLVDPQWLHGLAAGFAAAPETVLVSGLVPSGELRTPVQAYFDDRVTWSRNIERRVFSMASPPATLPMFPFSVGEFGTGANFAMKRDVALRMRGFDTAFGVGTPTGGGEDLDIFTRVLFDGGTLVVEPSAVVWHRHRAELRGLEKQTRGYGVGLGAWLTKIALNPRTAVLAARRAPVAVGRLLSKRSSKSVGVRVPGVPPAFPEHVFDGLQEEFDRLARYELRCVVDGPRQYLLQRLRRQGVLRG